MRFRLSPRREPQPETLPIQRSRTANPVRVIRADGERFHRWGLFVHLLFIYGWFAASRARGAPGAAEGSAPPASRWNVRLAELVYTLDGRRGRWSSPQPGAGRRVAGRAVARPGAAGRAAGLRAGRVRCPATGLGRAGDRRSDVPRPGRRAGADRPIRSGHGIVVGAPGCSGRSIFCSRCGMSTRSTPVIVGLDNGFSSWGRRRWVQARRRSSGGRSRRGDAAADGFQQHRRGCASGSGPLPVDRAATRSTARQPGSGSTEWRPDPGDEYVLSAVLAERHGEIVTRRELVRGVGRRSTRFQQQPERSSRPDPPTVPGRTPVKIGCAVRGIGYQLIVPAPAGAWRVTGS